MNREQLIKFIPVPKNSDVILYDINLKNLIDINVIEEYNKIFPIFINEEKKYNILKRKITEYQNSIDNIYLFNTSWGKDDYLIKLQNDKKTYNTLYNDINRIENNINMFQKRITAIDEKIEIQISKEKKLTEQKKIDIDKNIENNKNKLFTLKSKLKDVEIELENINKKIKENEIEFQNLMQMQSELKKGEYQCKYCGSIVKVWSENSMIYKRLLKNTEENKSELESLMQKQDKIKNNYDYYKKEISLIKIELNNDLQFKKQDYNFYTKKSIEVLKLEALRDEMINNIDKLQKSLKTYPQLNSEQYKQLKDNIEKYELSLNNLERMSEMKKNLELELKEFDILKNNLNEMYKKLTQYKKFLTIYYKIYEQKANDFFGKDFKFKLFKFNDFELKAIFEIYYKDIEYTKLSKQERDFIDKIFIEKIDIFC